MSEPITIGVRDLTAEHIGWTVNPEATIAAITEPDTLGCRGVLIQWTDRTEWMTKSGGHVWKITPPPPPDPWADEPPMVGGNAYAVQIKGDPKPHDVTSDRIGCESWIFRNQGYYGKPMRVVRATGWEVVQ